MTRSKYRSKPTIYNGVRYASKAEAARACEFDFLLRAGHILLWIGQPTIRLGVPENVYRPDFLVIPTEGLPWFEDVKGVETQKFRRDKKLWARYGKLPLRIITGGRTVEVIEPSSVEIEVAEMEG